MVSGKVMKLASAPVMVVSGAGGFAAELSRELQRDIEPHRGRFEIPLDAGELAGDVEARARLRPIVRLRTRERDGPWRSAIPEDARREGDTLVFELPGSGPEPLLKALIDGGAGIESLAIERPGLHEAFVAIAGDAAAKAMDAPEEMTP